MSSADPRFAKTLHETVAHLHGIARRRVDPWPQDLRMAAAELAVYAYGMNVVTAVPALVNVAALALAMGTRVVTHRLAPGVVSLVRETHVHHLPGTPPRLLRRAWLLESRRPKEGQALFGDTVCLGGYPVGPYIFLVGYKHPDGVAVARWNPRWGEESIDDPRYRAAIETHPLLTDRDRKEHTEWALQAIRFAFVCAVLLEADGAPVEVLSEGEAGKGRKARKRSKKATRKEAPPEYTPVIRRVRLLEPRYAAEASRPSGRGAPLPEGRIAVPTHVRGHLKRQPYGPGRKLRKWIYVADYEARRWITPRPLEIRVQPPGHTRGTKKPRG